MIEQLMDADKDVRVLADQLRKLRIAAAKEKELPYSDYELQLFVRHLQTLIYRTEELLEVTRGPT